MAQKSTAALIVAAFILGGSLIGAALIIRSSLSQTNQEIASIREALKEAARPTAPTAPTRQAAPRPDPNRRYSINVDGAPAKGPDGAKITLVEFSDFQCPFCRRVNPTIQRIQDEYGDQVRVVFKHLPLRIHPKAPAAHAAAEAAHRQGKFWEMHDAIFADQAGMSPERYREYAQKLGLDVGRFDRDLEGDEVKKRVSTDAQEAQKMGVTGTPAFFVNGRYLSGAQPFERFKALIDEELSRG